MRGVLLVIEWMTRIRPPDKFESPHRLCQVSATDGANFSQEDE